LIEKITSEIEIIKEGELQRNNLDFSLFVFGMSESGVNETFIQKDVLMAEAFMIPFTVYYENLSKSYQEMFSSEEVYKQMFDLKIENFKIRKDRKEIKKRETEDFNVLNFLNFVAHKMDSPYLTLIIQNVFNLEAVQKLVFLFENSLIEVKELKEKIIQQINLIPKIQFEWDQKKFSFDVYENDEEYKLNIFEFKKGEKKELITLNKK
jgi:hypothetical protein